MTEREDIDMLRRQVADLTERVRTLEARPLAPIFTDPYVYPIRGPIYRPAGSPPSTGTPLPALPIATCTEAQRVVGPVRAAAQGVWGSRK